MTWRLFDPTGRQVFGPLDFNSDVAATTLALSGSYTLLVEGRIWTTQYEPYYGLTKFDYRFNLEKVVETAPVALTLGATIDGSVQRAGQVNRYEFNLAEAAQLYFDSLTDSGNLAWTLSGPDGYTLSRAFNGSDSAEIGGANPLLKLAPGSYTLSIAGDLDAGDDYSFRLLDIAAQSTAISMGSVVSAALAPARSTDVYHFDAVAGERFFFDRLTAGDYWNTTYRLLDPNGNQVWGGYIWPDDQDTSTFGLSGTYTLLVEGRVGNGAATNAYSFNVQQVVDSSTALTIGATTAGSIAHAGQRANYTFSLTEASRLLFDGLAPNNANPDIAWTLTGPRGVEIASRRLYHSESYELGGTSPLLDLIAGDYTLSFDVAGDVRGDFSFRLLDLGSAMPITGEAVVSGQLNPANETDIYRFDAVVGKRYYIDRQRLSPGIGSDWQTWRLFDPNGRQVLGPQNLDDIDLFEPTQAGRYTLLVEGRIWNTQYRAATDYSFKLLEITDDAYDIVPGVAFGVDRNFTAGAIGGAVVVDSLRTIEVARLGRHRPDRQRHDRDLVQGRHARRRPGRPLFYKGNGNSSQRTYSLWLNSAGYLHLSTGDNGNQTVDNGGRLDRRRPVVPRRRRARPRHRAR